MGGLGTKERIGGSRRGDRVIHKAREREGKRGKWAASKRERRVPRALLRPCRGSESERRWVGGRKGRYGAAKVESSNAHNKRIAVWWWLLFLLRWGLFAYTWDGAIWWVALPSIFNTCEDRFDTPRRAHTMKRRKNCPHSTKGSHASSHHNRVFDSCMWLRACFCVLFFTIETNLLLECVFKCPPVNHPIPPSIRPSWPF